ncbi:MULTISPECIES: hypothetical protein [unclassified Microcoleus]
MIEEPACLCVETRFDVRNFYQPSPIILVEQASCLFKAGFSGDV